MVFPDLSAPEALPKRKTKPSQAIAFVSDRFVALVIDFLIFSPIISLFIAGFVRQTKTSFLLSGPTNEGYVGLAMVVSLIVALVVVLQSVFLFYWSATPGQLFLQLRVVSYPGSEAKLSYAQCLQRSFYWVLGFVLGGIPYLEVLSHPLRRAFHERASDTMTVTLKQQADDGPYPMEARFISSWLRMGFLLLACVGALTFLKSYNSLQAGDYKDKSTATDYACQEVQDGKLQGLVRLDTALTLFLLNEVTGECLSKEADYALWSDPNSTQSLAYLAKYLVADAHTQDQYLQKVCEDTDSTSCSLARYMQENGEKEELDHSDPEWMVTKLLISEELYASGNFDGSLKIITDLQKNPLFTNALEKRFVRSIWALRDQDRRKVKGRVPASAEEAPSWIDDFKERYEIQ